MKLPSRLFSVGLEKTTVTIAPLNSSNHDTPVEAFGGTNNFDVSATHIIYTAKDPVLPVAWDTRQNMYIVPLKGGETPRQLTRIRQGATNNPVFNNAGTVAAWTEMEEDGYEADRTYASLTPEWNCSADQLAFSPSGDSLIFLAGEHARIKIFSVAAPPSSDAKLSSPPIPVALTHSRCVGSVQAPSNGRILLTQSSFTSPNNVFLLSGFDKHEGLLKVEQITRFSESDLKEKCLDEGEEYWFKGADGRLVQGWILKPKGWKEGGHCRGGTHI